MRSLPASKELGVGRLALIFNKAQNIAVKGAMKDLASGLDVGSGRR